MPLSIGTLTKIILDMNYFYILSLLESMGTVTFFILSKVSEKPNLYES